jgi:hypothetical protein
MKSTCRASASAAGRGLQAIITITKLPDQFKVVNLTKVANVNFAPFVWRPEFMVPGY